MSKRITAINVVESGRGWRVSVVEREVKVSGNAINATPTERVVYEGNSFSEMRNAEDNARREMMMTTAPENMPSTVEGAMGGATAVLPLTSFEDFRRG